MADFHVLLLFGTIVMLIPVNVRPQGVFDQACALENGKDGFCVTVHQCRDNVLNVDGAGVVDLRFLDDCENYMLKCCSIETPCEDNEGTCVAASNCDADFNSSKYRLFKESEECGWNNYKCCPNERIRKTNSPKTQCGFDSVCVSDGECLAPQPRSSVCSGSQTCCPRNRVRQHTSSSCEETGGQCVRQGQCSSVFGINIRMAAACEQPGYECCMDSIEIATEVPAKEKSCVRGSGKCVPRRECKGTVYRDRKNECDGLVCCAVDTAVTSTTTRRPDTTGKGCIDNSGVCTTRKQCKGTVYRDRNNECEGLVCCATITPTVVLPTTTTPRSSAGKSCFNNGKCTLRQDCSGVVYRDRRNDCDGLVCCAASETAVSTTPRTFLTSTTTLQPVIAGKPCLDNSGKCTRREECRGTVYGDRENECGGLVCCTEPVRTCSSMKGICAAESSCLRRSTNSAVDCSSDTVCCLEVVVEIKECGYRNVRGVKFNTVNRNDGESQYGEFPWMVALMTETSGELKYFCGGSLIHPAVVLTSAECLRKYRRTPSVVTVRAGEWDMGSELEPIPYQERQVKQITCHKQFQPNTLLNNVALAFLEDGFNLGPTVNTICLPPQNFSVDNRVTGMGWGTTPRNRKQYQQILKSIDLPYADRDDCERTLRKALSNRKFQLHYSFICAGGEPGIDTCTGDGGSPVVYYIPDDLELRYYAVGMVSWGVGCGRSGVPAAYTNIGVFRDWIDRQMEEENFEMRHYEYRPKDIEDL
ncbi:transmembrane protease serine 2-like isoform X2 [Aedes albopictus]|uniref:Peptidase S1 domain-containing protein n=1 Tax=Aedes albopictus TaxID=7160 RepID=A0ABM1ZFP4_AEDAL|nr:uncharacterized protein LOC115257537 isoform X2 [Aedes albopictus]